MRLVQGMSFSTVVLSALLMPAVGTAAPWTHSWCVPGAPLTSPAPTGTDANLVNAFNAVCTALPACCSNTSSGHWGLACVQKAANIVRQNNWTVSGKNDYCGRYAWAQGPIANTQQYYPRDFSLFTLGDATLTDVEGPVAAGGNVTASSFSLNSIQQDPVVARDAGHYHSQGWWHGLWAHVLQQHEQNRLLRHPLCPLCQCHASDCGHYPQSY